MSDKPNTPETDDLLERGAYGSPSMVNHARRLERERNEARVRCDALWNEAAKAAVERDQLRAEVERLTRRGEYVQKQQLEPALEREASLHAQLAQRDEALKVAIEAIMAYEKAMQNGPENLSFRRYEELSEQGQAALRRIEGLTKEKQSHE